MNPTPATAPTTPHFVDLGLTADLCRVLAGLGYGQPTPVQAAALGAVLQGADVLACAPTGSGKTAAYALPLLQRLLLNPQAGPAPTGQRRVTRQLVLVPTRELAAQVGATLRAVANRLPRDLRISVLSGGGSVNPQLLALRGGSDCVVATPGRLLDVLAHNGLHLGGLETLVLDEADRLLDAGFAEEWQRIANRLPQQRQNLLWSATLSPAVTQLASAWLHQPVCIDLSAQNPTHPRDIEQHAWQVPTPGRTAWLAGWLRQRPAEPVLVFVATRYAAETVAAKLRKAGLAAEPLHGQLGQGKRTQVLADFKAGRLPVVVATDLAARGIDVPDLPLVVNFDLARSPSDHVHRVGRTGRAGAAGLAISLVPPEAQAHWQLLARKCGLAAQLQLAPGLSEADARALSAVRPATDAPNPRPDELPRRGLDPNGGVKGRRPSKKDRLRAAAQPGGPGRAAP